MRLALTLHYPHPDYLLPLLTSKQYDDWEIYDTIEPFGQRRSDRMAGEIAAANANLWRGEGSPAASPFDYMPGYYEPQATEEDIQAGTLGFVHNMQAVNRGS